jgi:hypothetical protein
MTAAWSYANFLRHTLLQADLGHVEFSLNPHTYLHKMLLPASLVSGASNGTVSKKARHSSIVSHWRLLPTQYLLWAVHSICFATPTTSGVLVAVKLMALMDSAQLAYNQNSDRHMKDACETTRSQSV